MPPTSPALLKTFTTRPDQTGCPATLIACGFKLTRLRRLRRHVLDSTTHDLPHRIEWQLAGFVGSPADMFTVTAAHSHWSNAFARLGLLDGVPGTIERARFMFCTLNSLKSGSPIVIQRFPGKGFGIIRRATRPIPGAENITPLESSLNLGEIVSVRLAAVALSCGHDIIGFDGSTQQVRVVKNPAALAPLKLLRAFLADESLIRPNDNSTAAILCAALINAERLLDVVRQAPELSSLHQADPAAHASRAALLPTKGSSQLVQDRVAQHLGL